MKYKSKIFFLILTGLVFATPSFAQTTLCPAGFERNSAGACIPIPDCGSGFTLTKSGYCVPSPTTQGFCCGEKPNAWVGIVFLSSIALSALSLAAGIIFLILALVKYFKKQIPIAKNRLYAGIILALLPFVGWFVFFWIKSF